jgi:hypothetical protein
LRITLESCPIANQLAKANMRLIEAEAGGHGLHSKRQTLRQSRIHGSVIGESVSLSDATQFPETIKDQQHAQ